MHRITQLEPEQSSGKTRQLFDAVKSKLGTVPNLIRVLGVSPAALEGYLSFSGALAGGTFGVKLREQIALSVAESNLCSYCLSVHSFLAGKVGLSHVDIDRARQAEAADPRTDAILKLARNIVVQRGEISDADLASTRTAGLTDADIVETVANVSVNILTNYMNHVARTVIDFPEVKPGQVLAGA